MIVELGHYALVLALALALFNSFVPFWGIATRDERLMATAPSAALVQFAFIAISFAALYSYRFGCDLFELMPLLNSMRSRPHFHEKEWGIWREVVEDAIQDDPSCCDLLPVRRPPSDPCPGHRPCRPMISATA